MKIAAIIITYNRKELLVNSIQSVLKGSIVPDIIVVDNASTDGTNLVLRDLPVQYLLQAKNLGPAGGAEAGQRYAHEKGYDFVWMLDDDAEVHPEALANLIRVYDELHKSNIILTSVTYGDRDFLRPIFNILLYNNRTGLTKRMPEENYSKDYFKCNISPMLGMFIPTEVFNIAGFFKGEYFGWYDDTEFILRAQKNGHECFAVSQSKIYHPTEYRKRVKILGRNFTFLSGRPERMYFGTRNNIMAQREFLSQLNFWIIFLPLFTIKRFISIVGFYENKQVFLKQFFKGVIDGVKGQS
ncbi:MAG: glycosyltransferase [Caldisericaceae bacterium]